MGTTIAGDAVMRFVQDTLADLTHGRESWRVMALFGSVAAAVGVAITLL